MVWSVPTIVSFTKFDALTARALAKLPPADRQLPLQERLSKAKPIIEEIFNRADIWGRLSQLKYPPRSCVRIGGLLYFLSLQVQLLKYLIYMIDMDKSYEGCISLLKNTAAVLNEKALQMLLVSAQKANMTLCIKYAAQKWVWTPVYSSLLIHPLCLNEA